MGDRGPAHVLMPFVLAGLRFRENRQNPSFALNPQAIGGYPHTLG